MRTETATVDRGRIEESFCATPDRKASSSKRGMVATAFPEATDAGAQMLGRGGNAVDAACAASLALAACEPQASGIGGQTIALIHVNGRTVAIDGSSRAPSLAHRSKFARAKNRFLGYRASTVPSTVAVIGYLNEHYGRLDWEEVVAPAIRIAGGGYRITSLQHRCQKDNLEKFLSVKAQSGARYFLRDGQVPYGEGDLFVQEDLAETLSHIGRYGYHSFYYGKIAEAIDADMRRNGGLLRKEDLALVPTPVERRPVSRKYRGIRVYTIPPPGAGDTMLLALMILDNLPREYVGEKSHDSYHYLAETFRKALLYRTQRPFDPSTYHHIANRTHLSYDFARRIAGSIRESVDPALPLREPPSGPEDTTHLSVMDDEGNAVSMTQSIELVYGSKAAAGGLGFLYNNYMSAFETENPTHPFFLRPNAVPWSSVCPSMAFDGGKPWIAMGSPGSERIFSTVSLFLSRLFDEENSMYEAMERPRMHCSLGGSVSVETDGAGDRLASYLEGRGYSVRVLERYSFYLGTVHAVLRSRDGESFQGVADVRRDGTAGGPA